MSPCPECGREFKNLKTHQFQAHGTAQADREAAQARRERERVAGTGSPEARAALDAQLRRIEQLEREVPDYDELVEGGRRQREAAAGRKRPAA